jgi:hypothetical protein
LSNYSISLELGVIEFILASVPGAVITKSILLFGLIATILLSPGISSTISKLQLLKVCPTVPEAVSIAIVTCVELLCVTFPSTHTFSE